MSGSARGLPGPRVLIAVATGPERSCIEPVTRATDHVRLIQTGPGSAMDRTGGADGLISAGTAAGLKPALPPGTILLPERVGTDGDHEYPVHPSWHAQLFAVLSGLAEIETGLLVSVPQVLTDPAAKKRLHARTGAVAADMESASLAAAASGRRLPFVVLRVVMDAAEDRVPGAAVAGVRADGQLNLLAVLRALAGKPSDLGALITTSLRFMTAARSLRRAFAAAAPQLALPDAIRV